MENLQYLLYQHRTKTALYLGHRFAYRDDNLEEGYMAGKHQIETCCSKASSHEIDLQAVDSYCRRKRLLSLQTSWLIMTHCSRLSENTTI